MKDKIKYRGKNIVGAFMNVPIFIGNFCVVTDFVVVKNMDAYHDKDMGDVIAGKPFCRASCVEARWFDGLITIHDGLQCGELTIRMMNLVVYILPEIKVLNSVRHGMAAWPNLTPLRAMVSHGVGNYILS
ncbi:hypothetical protein Tco_0723784 [Tanacetum coccineum]